MPQLTGLNNGGWRHLLGQSPSANAGGRVPFIIASGGNSWDYRGGGNSWDYRGGGNSRQKQLPILQLVHGPNPSFSRWSIFVPALWLVAKLYFKCQRLSKRKNQSSLTARSAVASPFCWARRCQPNNHKPNCSAASSYRAPCSGIPRAAWKRLGAWC